jgi:hypothetical protein
MDYEAIDAKLVWFQKQVKDITKSSAASQIYSFSP